MICALCNGFSENKRGSLDFKSHTFGTITVPDIQYTECEECGDKLLSPEESLKITDYIKNEEQKEIDKIPGGQLMSLNQVAVELGVKKQAISQNHRIRRGFIYSVEIDGRRYYDRESVKRFKKTKNGKYLLVKEAKPAEVERKIAGNYWDYALTETRISEPRGIAVVVYVSSGPISNPDPETDNQESEYRQIHPWEMSEGEIQ